ASTFLGDQRLDPFLESIAPQASGAFLEVLAQLLSNLRGAFAVEQCPYLGDHCRALGLDPGFIASRRVSGTGPGREFGHDDTSSDAWPPRMKPRSFATSVNNARSWRLPRCRRDITVPIGVSMISAISLYGKPSTSA